MFFLTVRKLDTKDFTEAAVWDALVSTVGAY